MSLKDIEILDEKDLSLDDDGSFDGEGGLWPVERLKPVVEALLFASGDPLQVKRVCQAVEGATRDEVLDALEAVGQDYAGRGIRLAEVAGGWQLRTAPEHHAFVKRLFKERPQRLTRAAVETMAIVAYKQPCTRADIEAIRGVDCGGVLESLVERRFLRIAGRRDVPGRPLVYATTKEFLELFGLKNLRELPTLVELGDDIKDMAEAGHFGESEDAEAPIIPLDGGELGDGHAQQEGAPQEAGPEQQGAQDAEEQGAQDAGERGAQDAEATAPQGDGSFQAPRSFGAAAPDPEKV